MSIGEKIFEKLDAMYTGPKDIEYSEYELQGFYENPKPRMYYDSLYLNFDDIPYVCLDIKKKNSSIEVHVGNTIFYVGTCDSGIDKFDEKIVQILCDKYNLIRTNHFKNHFYNVINSIHESEIKTKVGQMLTAVMTLYLIDHHKDGIKTEIKDEYSYYGIRRNFTFGNIEIKTVKEYLKNHNWVLKVEDTESGVEVETLFVDSEGEPLKISVYQNDYGVYFSSVHNYQELSKIENINEILSYFYCEKCDYLGFDKIESKIETEKELPFFEFFVAVLLIAENVPVFNEFMKDKNN